MKLTNWFSGKIKPAYVGVYERCSSYGFSHYSYWNGKSWKQMAFTPDKAQELSWDDDSYFQHLESIVFSLTAMSGIIPNLKNNTRIKYLEIDTNINNDWTYSHIKWLNIYDIIEKNGFI